MSSISTAADQFSLRLPDWRAAVKRRVRRPHRPDRLTALAVLECVGNGVVAVMQLQAGKFGLALPCLLLCGAWWSVLQAPRGSRLRDTLYTGCFMAQVLAVAVVL